MKKSILFSVFLSLFAISLSSCGNGSNSSSDNKHDNKPTCNHDMTFFKEIEASCVEEGTKAYYQCKNCDGKFWTSDGQLQVLDDKALIINALGHKVKHNEKIEQTCTKDGVDEHYFCIRCEKYFKDENCENEIYDPTVLIHHATGHRLEHVEGIEPTCISQGKREYWHCSTCNKNFSLSAGDYEIKDESTLIISPLGHNKIDTVYYDDEKHRNACSRCDIHLDEHEHNYVETSKVTEGSCIEEHKGLFECDGCDKYIVRSVAPTGHNLSDTLYDENNHWKECLNCGEKFLVGTHNMDGGIVTKQPTCTTKGLKEYHCSDCDYQYQEMLPFAEHTSREYFKDEESHWQNCSECGIQFNLHNHDFSISTMIKEPTFAEEGLKRLTCSQCGYEKEVVLEKTQLIYMINGEGTGYIVLGTNSTQENLELYIPEEYNGLPVVEIGGSAFEGSQNIVSFYSSKNIKKIGKHAFSRCDFLSYIELNEGLKVIDVGAFSNSNLSLVQEDFLPDSIEAINEGAFSSTQLKGIILKNISCLGQHAFQSCQKLTSVTLNPELFHIGFCAFLSSAITQISIPKNVKIIGFQTFDGCNSLARIEFEDSESKRTNGTDFIDVSDPTLNVYLFTKTYVAMDLEKV